jgi:hypothetical protein
VFSTSHGAFASTPTRSTPAFLMASMRGLAPGAGTGTSANAAATLPARAQHRDSCGKHGISSLVGTHAGGAGRDPAGRAKRDD